MQDKLQIKYAQFLPLSQCSGEELQLISQTAAGNQAYR